MSERYKYCWNCEFFTPLGVKGDGANGKCYGNPATFVSPSGEGDGIPRVAFSSYCSCWQPHPEKMKIPGNDPLQNRIDSAIKELEQFGMAVVKRNFEFMNPTLKDVERDPSFQRFQRIIQILNGIKVEDEP